MVNNKTDIRASFVEAASSVILTAYIRLCHATTRWSYRGKQDLLDALAKGPVVLVLWHSRTVMGPPHWPDKTAPVTSLFVTNRDGRIAAGIQARFRFHPLGMDKSASNLAASRGVLRRLRQGHSLILTADGPRGPARVLQSAPLEWIRSTDCPVFVYANSVHRQKRLPGWDRLLFPLPFTRGACVFQRWPEQVSRRPTDAQLAGHDRSLTAALDAVLQEADDISGVPRGA
ncbi:MAG: DUF374 domain-containing protein [Paracoccaceae bacterium]